MNEQQQHPTGIVGNTREGGTRATEARQTLKSNWDQGPWLHAGIAIAVILVGIVLITNFQFNFFWKIVLGATTFWLAVKLANTDKNAFKTWGKILKGLGGVIIALALLQSGIRHFAEGTVNWVDRSLCEVWSTGCDGKATDTGAAAATPSFKMESSRLPAVDLRKVPVGGSVEFIMELNNTVPVWYRTVHVNEPGEGSYWACFEVVNKDSYDKVIMFTTLAGAGTNENIVGLTEDTQNYLYQTYGFIRLKVRVTLVRSWDKPCANVL